MIYGFKARGSHDLPEWASRLTGLYWFVRVEGRDMAKRRKYYRRISKEKLRLAELGIDQQLINAVCKYLVSLSDHRGLVLRHLQLNPPVQLELELVYVSNRA